MAKVDDRENELLITNYSTSYLNSISVKFLEYLQRNMYTLHEVSFSCKISRKFEINSNECLYVTKLQTILFKYNSSKLF